MAGIFSWWIAWAGALVLLGLVVGLITTRHPLGLLIDSRGRYSLTHL